MYEHKMRPLQTTKSVHSIRSNIEKQLEEGMSFADREEPVGKGMPKHYLKHMNLLIDKQLNDTESQFAKRVRV
jgi:hypothetical protein